MISPCPRADGDAAYVLGALSETEHRDYATHLDVCSSCRAAVDRLEPLPSLLALLGDESNAARGEPSPLAALARAARRTRRRCTALVVAMAAALALVAGAAGNVLVTAVVASTADAAAVPVDLRPVESSGVRADVSLTAEPWGTRLDWSCSYPVDIAAGHRYELAVTDTAGVRRVVASWTGDGGPTDGLAATTAIVLDDIARLELSSTVSGTLLAAADL